MSEENLTLAKVHDVADPMVAIREKLRACMQCGTCTGSCANAFAMDYTPRQLWRMVQLGLTDELFNSKTFSLCSSCYYCTLRCPRGLPLTEAIHGLKQLAVARGISEKKGSRFSGARQEYHTRVVLRL